jgi:hypothetical protein
MDELDKAMLDDSRKEKIQEKIVEAKKDFVLTIP